MQDDGVYGAVDDLTYTYNGNQVVKVDDAVDGPYYKDAFHFVDGANEETEYEYDGNGNMTKDLNKKISQIEYNCLNLFPKKQYGLRLGNLSKLYCSRFAPYLPQRISYQDGSHVLYTYDAGGVKLRTDYYINPLASSVPQVAGATGSAGTTLKHTWTDYCGNFIYENDSLKQTLVAGGYVSYLYSQGATTPTSQYHFYVQDHLGDNRVVADEKGNIEQINHYYPFGGLMGESRNLTSNQKYKYNGKELDRMHGLDWYDYGARNYDADLGQWHAVDPLAEKYYGISPYAYCYDNSMKYIDIDGREMFIYGTAAECQQILATLQKLTNDNLFFNRKTGAVTIGERRWSNRNKKLNKGTQLIRNIVNDKKHTMTISHDEERNHQHDDYPKDALNGKGTDVIVYFDPNETPALRTKSSRTGKVRDERLLPYIALGHELVHGYRSMNGIAESKESMAWYKTTEQSGAQLFLTYEKKEELITVGIIGHYPFTENILRKEHGLDNRINY